MTHEEAVVRSFKLRSRQEHACGLLSNAKRRHTFTKELAHFKWLDPRFAKSIPANQHKPSAIFELLKKKGKRSEMLGNFGRSQSGWSRARSRSGAELRSWVMEWVTILSCIPGKLGYFEDEDVRFILER